MEASTRRRLLGFALAVIVGHHDGVLLAPLGEVGPTRWADWIDLALPLAVLGFAGATLLSADARRPTWIVFALGALLYAQGHGIHLAANSVSNVDPGETAYLWDEVVGHYLWYAGFAVIVAALAVALADRKARGGVAAHLLAAAVGFTHFTNSIEGQTPWLGIGTALVFSVWGLLTLDGMGRYLVTTYGLSLVLFAGYRIWQGGFPEFSELGWI